MLVASKVLLWDGLVSNGETILVVHISEELKTIKIAGGSLAPLSKAVKISWGDGTKDILSDFLGRMHTYDRSGEYVITISDDISSFGFTSDIEGDEVYRPILIELVSIGSKVTRIEDYAFNNCKNMRGRISLPYVTEIGDYAFGSIEGIGEIILPSLTYLNQESFFAGPSPSRLYVDNVVEIDSRFFEYYGGNLKDLYIRNLSRFEIKDIHGFPFEASGDVRFHGSDGIILANGLLV